MRPLGGKLEFYDSLYQPDLTCELGHFAHRVCIEPVTSDSVDEHANRCATRAQFLKEVSSITFLGRRAREGYSM